MWAVGVQVQQDGVEEMTDRSRAPSSNDDNDDVKDDNDIAEVLWQKTTQQSNRARERA